MKTKFLACVLVIVAISTSAMAQPVPPPVPPTPPVQIQSFTATDGTKYTLATDGKFYPVGTLAASSSATASGICATSSFSQTQSSSACGLGTTTMARRGFFGRLRARSLRASGACGG